VDQITAFLADPANFLIGLDLQQGQFQFIHMPREEISSKAFLDTRAMEPGHKRAVLQGDAILQVLAGGPPLKANYLFHSSFCCSTLIARCLDFPGKNLSLKEPFALLGLSGFKRRSKNFDRSGEVWKNWRDPTLKLLSRPHLDGEQVLMKPSNGANNILPEILDYSGTGKVVLLYSLLDHFLAAVISGGQDRFGYVGSILPLFIRDFGAGLDLPDRQSLTPLQRAALVWALQMKTFKEVAAVAPEKVRTLDCQNFLDDPVEILLRLNAFYGMGFSRTDLEAVASGPVMTMHSKEPGKAHSAKDQKQETLKAIHDNRKELTEVTKWCREFEWEFEQSLPNPL